MKNKTKGFTFHLTHRTDQFPEKTMKTLGLGMPFVHCLYLTLSLTLPPHLSPVLACRASLLAVNHLCTVFSIASLGHSPATLTQLQ